MTTRLDPGATSEPPRRPQTGADQRLWRLRQVKAVLTDSLTLRPLRAALPALPGALLPAKLHFTAMCKSFLAGQCFCMLVRDLKLKSAHTKVHTRGEHGQKCSETA